MEEQMEAKKPEWLMGNGNINEQRFCQWYLHENLLLSREGVFYNENGRIYDERILREMIYDYLKDFVTTGIQKKVTTLVEALRLAARSDDPDALCTRLDVLHVANGTYNIFDSSFMPEKFCCRHRLPVAYNPGAEKPERWLQFLQELLYEEDIPTLQEYMGYCLIPTNIGQKMLIITGRGGEGKSRIGIVLKTLLGNNMHVGSLNKVETNRFARADLEHLLVLVDDDLKMEALSQTNHIKAIVTAELPMDMEKKGVQSYQGDLKVRFLAFGNDTLQALHDRSFGFFRRQILLCARERPRDRVDNPYLANELRAEAEGIFLWCLEGLMRLVNNDFHFTLSKRARVNLLRSMTDANNLEGFMASEGYFRFDREGKISSRGLYSIYCDWCEDNMLRALSPRSFSNYMVQNLNRFSLGYTNKIPDGNGKVVRGFLGIRKVSGF